MNFDIFYFIFYPLILSLYGGTARRQVRIFKLLFLYFVLVLRRNTEEIGFVLFFQLISFISRGEYGDAGAGGGVKIVFSMCPAVE